MAHRCDGTLWATVGHMVQSRLNSSCSPLSSIGARQTFYGMQPPGCSDSRYLEAMCSIQYMMTFNKVMRIPEYPPRADNEVSQAPAGIPRRRRIHARSADVSANGPSMRSPGRYIGAAPIYRPGWLAGLIWYK